VLLNFYLHSGVTWRWVEATLPRAYFNTSAHHNIHHSHADTNFAEAFTIWDYLCGTRLEGEGVPNKTREAAARVIAAAE
jgi:lathosterol oxidase